MYKIVWSGHDSEKKHGQRKWHEGNNGIEKGRIVDGFFVFFFFCGTT